MTKRPFLPVAGGIGCFFLGAAAAFAVGPQLGSPDLQMGVSLSMTPPKAVPCGNPAIRGCFRSFVEARSTDSSAKRIAILSEGDGRLSKSFAYLESGGICRASILIAAPRAISWSNGGYSLPDGPENISSTRPFSFPVQFACDQPVEVGDKAQIQLIIAVGNGKPGNITGTIEGAEALHFKWPDVSITGASAK